MRSVFAFLVSAAAAALVSGCATGVPYSSMASSIPPLKDGEGRIFFYRSASRVGAALTPELRLNGAVVGKSQAGGFFFVDRPAGTYQAAATTEVEKTLSLSLDEGEIKYVRASPSLGVMVGRIVLELEAPQKAKSELTGLRFAGKLQDRPSAARGLPAQPVTSASGITTLDDLRGLLPAK
jgi:hypothetical protein